MSRLTVIIVSVLVISAFALGALLGSHPSTALAQDKETAPDVKALTQPPPVVTAIPFQYHTDYEQDPFDQTKLRRTQTTVTKIAIVRSNGSTEMKDLP